jgi:hypothetical protein
MPQLNLDVTGTTTTDPDEDPVEPSDEVKADITPAPPAPTAAAPAAPVQGQSTITKSKPAAN